MYQIEYVFVRTINVVSSVCMLNNRKLRLRTWVSYLIVSGKICNVET